MRLGDFGVIEREVAASTGDAATSPEPDTFTFFGEEIRIRDDINPYSLMRFAAEATGQFDMSELALYGLIISTMRKWVEPADWPKFEGLAEKHGADASLLGQVVGGLYNELVGRPTRRSSSSASGRPGETSGEASSEQPSPDSPDSNSPDGTGTQEPQSTTEDAPVPAAIG